MSIKFLNNSILTTFQDLGRNGFRRFGVNPGGAMDKTAVRLLNILLGNDENETVLEIHFPSSELKFENTALIALGGAEFCPQLNGVPVENWKPFWAEKGSVLSFTGKNFGARCYLSVKGGFQAESWLKSSSANLKAGFGKPFKKNDLVKFNENSSAKEGKRFSYRISANIIPHYSNFPTVRVFAGAEFDNLTALSESLFLKKSFKILPESDRMGFRLSGDSLYLLDSQELTSSAVNFGTIQLLPNGQLIVLMADHQTTGGYPRIAHVVSADLPLLAQLNPNDKIAFHLVSRENAEEIFLRQERDFNLLKIGVKSLR